MGLHAYCLTSYSGTSHLQQKATALEMQEQLNQELNRTLEVVRT